MKNPKKKPRKKVELLNTIPYLKEEVYVLRKELAEKEEQLSSNQTSAAILDDLFKRGIIDEDGNIIQ